MKKQTIAASSATLLILTACASLTPPTAQSLAQIPVIKYGEQAPANQPFVLLYPAGVDIPMKTSVTGSLLEKTDASTLNVKLKHDLYIYQHWASVDGTTWQQASSMVDSKLLLNLPGEKDGASPGNLSAEFNLK